MPKRGVELIGEIVGVVERGGVVAAVIILHPGWPEPFEVALRSRGRQFSRNTLIGRRVRFSHHPEPQRSEPRSPLFVGLEP